MKRKHFETGEEFACPKMFIHLIKILKDPQGRKYNNLQYYH